MLESFFVSVTPGIGGQWQNLVGMLKPASYRMLRRRWAVLDWRFVDYFPGD